MKQKKPENRVANMAVLSDIRGLLSTARPKPDESKTDLKPELDSLRQAKAELEQQVIRLRAQVESIEGEKATLAAKVKELEKASGDKTPVPAGVLSADASAVEARRVELEKGLRDVESLLLMKVRELSRRIARIYEDAGDYGATSDFRKMADRLEQSENFGEFVRALVRD